MVGWVAFEVTAPTRRSLTSLRDLASLPHPAVIVGLVSVSGRCRTRGHDILATVSDVALTASHENKSYPLLRTTVHPAAAGPI